MSASRSGSSSRTVRSSKKPRNSAVELPWIDDGIDYGPANAAAPDLAPGPSSYVYLGSRVVRGWAIELVLIGALLPFVAATVGTSCRAPRSAIGCRKRPYLAPARITASSPDRA